MLKKLPYTIFGILLIFLSSTHGQTFIDQNLLIQAQNYLNNLRNFKANFHQTNPDQSTSLGEFYLRRLPNKRNGQIRLLYTKPTLLLIVADGEKIIYQEDGQPPSVYSLDVTPASALLQAHIDFNNPDIMVLSAARQGAYIMITLAKPGEDSSLTLIFTTTPKLRLAGWTVLEGNGKQTLVKLSNITTPSVLPDALFINESSAQIPAATTESERSAMTSDSE